MEIKVEENERFVKVSGGARLIYVVLGLVFLAPQVLFLRSPLCGNATRDELLVWLLMVCFFGAVIYVMASWHPFHIFLLKDKERNLLVFFAAPGCWRKKVYPLTPTSGFLVEDRGEGMGRLYLLAEERRRLFDGNLRMLRDLASKAAEAFGMSIRYN